MPDASAGAATASAPASSSSSSSSAPASASSSGGGGPRAHRSALRHGDVIALDLLTSSSSSSSSAAGGSDVSVAVRAALPSLGVRFSTVWVDSFAQAVEMSLWVVEAPVAAASDELRGGSAQDKRAAAAASAAGTGTPAGVSSASTAGTVSSSSSSSSAAASSQRDDSSPLVYGEMLSLRHRATGLYLCVQTSSAGVTIKPRADAGSWTMQSASRHRVRGSAVSHGDALVLLAFPSLMKLNAQEASEASIGFQNHIFRVRKLADAPPANALQFYNIVRLSWRSHADLVLTPQSVVKRSLVSAVIGEASPQSSSSVASMWIVEPLGALAAGADGASAMSGASSDANVSGGVGRTANGAGAVHWGSEALLRSMIDGKYLAVFPTRSAAAGVPDGASGAAGTAAGADTSGIVRSRVRTGTLDRRPGARRASDAAAGAATGGAAAAAAQPRPPLGVFGVPLPQGHVWTAADAKPWNTAANAGSAGGSAYDRLQELCLEDELRVGHTLVPGDLGEGDFHVLAVFHPELWRTNRDDLLPLLPQAPLFDGLTAADIQDRIRGEHLVWKLESCRRESTYVLQVPVSLHDPFFLRHKSTDTVLRLGAETCAQSLAGDGMQLNIVLSDARPLISCAKPSLDDAMDLELVSQQLVLARACVFDAALELHEFIRRLGESAAQPSRHAVTPAEIHALVALMSQAADAVSIPFAQREHLVSALGHSTIMDDIVVLLAFCRAGRQGTAHAVQLLVLQNVCLRFLLKAVDPSLFAARVLHTMLLGRERVNALVLGDDAPDSTLGRVRAALEAQLPAAFRAALLDDVHMRRYVISELIGDVHVALNQGQPTILPVLECSLTSCGRLRGEFIMHRRGALLSELVRALFADDVIRLTWMQAIVRAFCVRPSLEDDTMAFDVSRRHEEQWYSQRVTFEVCNTICEVLLQEPCVSRIHRYEMDVAESDIGARADAAAVIVPRLRGRSLVDLFARSAQEPPPELRRDMALHVLQLSVFSMLGASPLAAHLLLTSLFPLSAIAAGLNDALMPVEPVLLTHLFELLNSLLLSHIWCPPSAGAVVSWPAVQRPPPLAGELFRLASTQQSSANATRGDASANGVDSGANSERGLFVLASLSASTRKHLAFAADRALEVLSYKATMKKRLGVDQQLQLPEFSADALNLVQQATQTACHALRQGTAFAAGTSAFHRLVFSCIELLDVAPVIRMGERDPSLVDLDAYFTMLEDVLRLLMVADDVLRRARADGAISAVSRDVTLKSMAFSIMQGIALFGARVRLLPAEVLRGVWESALWADDAQQYGKLHGRVVDAFARRYVERSPDKACFSVNLWAAYARGCNESAGARPSGAAGAAACSSVDAANAFVEIAARLAALLDGSGSFTLNRLALEFARRLFRVYDTTLDYFQHLQFVPAGPLQRGVAKLDGLMGELAQLVSVRASLNVTTPFSSSVAIADRDAYAALPSVRLRECLRQLLQLLSTCSVGSADRIVLQDAMRERDFVRMIFMLLAWRWPSEKVLLKNKLLRQAYDLLVHFVSGNRANQNAAIGLLPYMMRHAGYDVGVGNALCCLFDGNARLGASLPPATVSGIATLLLPRVSVADGAALSPGSSPQAADKAEQAAAEINRTSDSIPLARVWQLMAQCGDRLVWYSGPKSRYLVALSRLCVAEGKAIERNQRMVLGFVQTHMGPVMDFVESQADLQRRQEYFASAATVDRDRVGYHVAFIDLMADIAFRNDHTRTVVRRMFPLRMLHRNLQTRRTLDQGPVLTHNGARRAYWRLLTVRVCGLASDDVLLMPVQNVYMRRDVRGWVRAENAEDSSALWQSLFDWAAALLDRASFMVSDQAAVIVDGVLPFFEGAVHLLPLIPSLVDEHVSSWMRHVWIGFRRCVDTVVRQLVSPPSDPWIADLASKPLMAAAASLLSSVRERARVFGLDSAIVSDIERVLAAVQRSRSRAAELAGGALGSDTPLADAASSVGVGGPAAGGERATRSTLAAPSGVDRTGSVDAGQAALGAVRPPPAAAGDADGAAGERAALSASPSSGEEELGGPTPSQIRDLWTTYLQQMRRSVRRRAVKLEVFLVTFLRALRDKALNAVMLQGDPSRNGRREELLLFVLESIKVILWTARIGWEPPGELGVRDLLSLCVHGSARATDARTLFAAGFFGQMSRDEVQSVLERGDATLLTVALQPGVTSRHKLSAKHLDLIEPGETVPVLIVQGGDGEAAMTLWQRAQTYLNSDVVGATISVVRLTANPSARILKKAMATLAMLMDGGNPDVQRSVLKVINEGTTASSGVSVNLLQQLSLQFDSVVARTLSSPWWLDATQLVPALQTRALVPAAAGGGAGAGAGALTAASASGGAGGVGSAAADGMSAAVVPATLHDTGVVQPMLKFVKQLCENHKLEAQNVLREQKDSSYNIIQHLLHYLDSIVPARMPQWTLVQMDTQPERIRELLRPIATALEALTETIQGPCVGNQRVVLDGQGLEVLTNIVAMQSNLDRDELLGATTLETHRRIDALEPEREVFNLAVVCLESLIEGPSFAVNSRTMLAKSISSHLVRHLTVYGNVLLDGQCGFVVGGGIVTNAVRSAADGSTELGSALLHEAMEMYKLLRLLQLERGFGFVEGSSAVFSDAQLDPAHLELFERHLGMVEIARDSVVEPFVYQHDRLFGLVTRDDRRHLLRTRGTNQAEKLDNFVLELEALRVTLQLRDRVRRSKFRDRISSEKFERALRICANVFAVVANVLFLLQSVLLLPEVLVAFFVVAALLLGTNVLQMVSYVLQRFLAGAIRRRYSKARETPEMFSGQRASRMYRRLLFVLFALQQPSLYYISAQIVVSFLAVVLSPSWVCAHLIDILIRFRNVREMIRAVTKNFSQLALTFTLLLALSYLYGVLGFRFFNNSLMNSNDELLCTSLLWCWLGLLQQLPSGGEPIFRQLAFQGTVPDTAGYLFELTFYVIAVVLLLNMFFGIIVNTFIQIRQEREARELAKHSRCFICGISGTDFDRDGDGFGRHFREEHNIMLYVGMYLYLMQRAETDAVDMTGSESYLFHCLRPDATSTERFQVFPTERSMVLERRKRLATDDAAAEIDKQLARFESRQLQALQADLSAAQATLADAARFRTVQAQLESKRAALAGGLQELASKRKQVQATREQVIEQQRQIAQKAQ